MAGYGCHHPRSLSEGKILYAAMETWKQTERLVTQAMANRLDSRNSHLEEETQTEGGVDHSAFGEDSPYETSESPILVALGALPIASTGLQTPAVILVFLRRLLVGGQGGSSCGGGSRHRLWFGGRECLFCVGKGTFLRVAFQSRTYSIFSHYGIPAPDPHRQLLGRHQ